MAQRGPNESGVRGTAPALRRRCCSGAVPQTPVWSSTTLASAKIDDEIDKPESLGRSVSAQDVHERSLRDLRTEAEVSAFDEERATFVVVMNHEEQYSAVS
ncbi:hypothetical protein [Sorangium sp. So ce1182]|uniref:hypothetical protein n=1 Tax=Sorangium sp. So ce1182 TaxID=3133334 RepID=UPI003F6433DA